MDIWLIWLSYSKYVKYVIISLDQTSSNIVKQFYEHSSLDKK